MIMHIGECSRTLSRNTTNNMKTEMVRSIVKNCNISLLQNTVHFFSLLFALVYIICTIKNVETVILITEEVKRFKIFRDNMKRIDDLNHNLLDDATYGVTVFADMAGVFFNSALFPCLKNVVGVLHRPIRVSYS